MATFPETMAALAATRDLRGYWRLGDGSSPYADTSGNSGGPVDMVLSAHGVAMTPDYTPGALSEDQDDGAVAFNATTVFTEGDVLSASDTRFRLTPVTGVTGFTLMAFLKPFGFTTQSHQALGTFSPSNGGYAMVVGGTSGLLGFVRGDSGGTATLVGPAIPQDEWTFVVCVFGIASNYAQIYVNGVQAADHTQVQGLAGFDQCCMGGNDSGGPVYGSFYGGVDEASIWGDPLDADEILELYESSQTPPVGIDLTPLRFRLG